MLIGLVVVAAAAALSGASVGASGGGKPRASSTRVAAALPSRCVPKSLNGSALLPGSTVTVSPLPDSYDASPNTQISLLGVQPSTLSVVSATGSRSGRHPGSLRAYSQGDGASFVPQRPFQPGETVTVAGQLAAGGAARSFGYRFTVASANPLARVPSAAQPSGKPGDVQTFHSRPDLKPPAVAITTHSPLASPGYVFAAPYSGPGQDGPMIFDSSGQLVWFAPVPNGTEATDFTVQSYNGRPVLTWWQGYIPPQGFGQGEDLIADSSYHVIAHVKAGNGYQADLHEFQLTPQGTALLTVFNPIRCDLTAAGGPRDSAVTDGVLQELDLKTGLVRREWHSLDHVALRESYQPSASATRSWPFDYFHINSIDAGTNGTLLISARNTSAMYEVDPATGQIRARIGGRKSDFTMSAGTSTAFQHDARDLGDGMLTVFDNGAVPKIHPQSRAIVEEVDSVSHIVKLVRQYVHPSPLIAGSQANFQMLPNSDAFVGWGSVPYFSEFSPSGQLLFDAHLVGANESYRGYLLDWSATPTNPPAFAATPVGKSAVTVFASWNGATGVAAWNVLAGAAPGQLARVATAPRSGFETAIRASAAGQYVAVQALDGGGRVLGTSPPRKA
jgi:Arylsulfotransferase (ASST)